MAPTLASCKKNLLATFRYSNVTLLRSCNTKSLFNFIQMDNNVWIPPIGDAVDQNPISSSENGSSDQLSTPSPPLSTNIQPQKRQRKPRQPKNDLQPSGSSTSSESTSPSLDTKPAPDYRPNLSHLYRYPTQWPQLYSHQHLLASQNQHQLFTQSTQMPALNPYNPMYSNPWLSFPLSTAATSYPFNQNSQQRLANLTAFYRNQGGSLLPSTPAVTSQMNSQSSYGYAGSESRSQRYGLNYSPTYPENAQNAQYPQGGAMSAFQPFKRSATGETDDTSQNTSNKKSKVSHFNYDSVSQATHSPIMDGNNDTTKESAVNILIRHSQMDNGKVVEPAAVIDEKYDFSCVICQETRKDTVLMPCRHLCVCEKCSLTIELCPLCREVFNDTITVLPKHFQ